MTTETRVVTRRQVRDALSAVMTKRRWNRAGSPDYFAAAIFAACPPTNAAVLRARLDAMAPRGEDDDRRYARVAGDYLAELAEDAINALEGSGGPAQTGVPDAVSA